MNFATRVKCSTMFWICIVILATLTPDLVFAQQPLAIEPSNSRDAAIRDCSVEMQQWSDKDWETTKSARYGACMTNHDQMR
jgi:hypothetical protein